MATVGTVASHNQEMNWISGNKILALDAILLSHMVTIPHTPHRKEDGPKSYTQAPMYL